MVLVESVTVGLVKEADNGSSNAYVVIGFCCLSWSWLWYHMIKVSSNLYNLYICGLMPLVNSYVCLALDLAANSRLLYETWLKLLCGLFAGWFGLEGVGLRS